MWKARQFEGWLCSKATSLWVHCTGEGAGGKAESQTLPHPTPPYPYPTTPPPHHPLSHPPLLTLPAAVQYETAAKLMAELSPSWLQLVVVAVGLAQVRPVQAMQHRADPVCLLPLDMSRDAWLLLAATHSQLTCRYTPRPPHAQMYAWHTTLFPATLS